jgi:hypothetical protein
MKIKIIKSFVTLKPVTFSMITSIEFLEARIELSGANRELCFFTTFYLT